MALCRIETLELRIRTAEMRPALARQCQTLTRQVLERAAERVGSGDRVVLVRRLAIRWRLPGDMLASDHALERLASDLIAALEPAWSMPIESPDPDADVAVFADAAAWWSDALQARSQERVAWYHRPILDPEPLAVLAEPGNKPLALSVLRCLGQSAPDALRASPPAAVPALAKALDISLTEGVIGDLTRHLRYEVVALDGLSPELAALLPVPDLLAAIGPGAAPALVGLAALAFHLARAPASAPLEAEALAFTHALASATNRIPGISEGRAEPEGLTARELPLAPDALPAVRSASAASDPTVLETSVPPVEVTSYAGLFYLATLLLELGTGEHLWAACLPEGRFLGWAAAGLVGDDPVVNGFGGPDVSVPSVTAAQADEVMTKGCVELARALPRRRPDLSIPSLELFLVGEELFATLPGSVFPIWSSACLRASGLREEVAVLSERWPGGLSIPPTLDALGLRGRIHVQSERAPRILFRREGQEPAGRLATVAIGTAAALFEWRIDEPRAASPAAFVERWLKVPGRIEDSGDLLVVHLRAEDVAFPVRRAGLDRDPGFLPWIERTVVLRFDGDEPEGDDLPVISGQDSG